MSKTQTLIAATVAGTLLGIGAAMAQTPFVVPGSKPTELLRRDLTGVPNKQVVVFVYEVAPGTMVPLHTHPGDEFHFVIAGEWAAEVQGRPVNPMKPGDAQYVERDKAHGGKVTSAGPMKLLGLMIVDKDKPITQCAP